jgi:hypothetical protein
MTFLVPMRLATAPNPRKALRKSQLLLFGYIFLWAYLCLHWYPALVHIE